MLILTSFVQQLLVESLKDLRDCHKELTQNELLQPVRERAANY